jgi:hypothetical protein
MIVAEGTPAQVAQVAGSHTAEFLRRYFPVGEPNNGSAASIAVAKPANGRAQKSIRRSATVQ